MCAKPHSRSLIKLSIGSASKNRELMELAGESLRDTTAQLLPKIIIAQSFSLKYEWTTKNNQTSEKSQ